MRAELPRAPETRIRGPGDIRSGRQWLRHPHSIQWVIYKRTHVRASIEDVEVQYQLCERPNEVFAYWWDALSSKEAFGNSLIEANVLFVPWWVYRLLGRPIRRFVRKHYFSKHKFRTYRIGCEHCFFGFDATDESYFECTDSGCTSTMDGTEYWFEGNSTCPRCRKVTFMHEF